MTAPSFRQAQAADAETIARLHAISWQRHYRGAYSDSFLDGDVLEDRIAVWSERMSRPDPARLTVLAEDPAPVGFVNAVFAADRRFGTLLDNLHVVPRRQRGGVGTALVGIVAEAVLARGRSEGINLWVLEQNARARAFYEALGGVRLEAAPVEEPGGVAGRLAGTPRKLRYVWLDPRVAAGTRAP